MSFVQKSFIIGDYSLRCVLLLTEIVGLLAIFFGIPSSFIYFAWFTQQHLWPAIDSLENGTRQSREVFFSLILNASYSFIVIWGAIPYCNIRQSLSHRFRCCAAVISLLNSAVLTVLDLRIELSMRAWWFQFESTGHIYLVKHCQVMAVFFCVLLGLGLLVLQLLVSYTMAFGAPKAPGFLQQMLEDMRLLMEYCRFGRLVGSGESSETETIMNSEV